MRQAQRGGTFLGIIIGVVLGLDTSFHPFMGFPGYKEIAHLPLADEFEIGSEGTEKVTGLTFGVIAVMLLVVYRSLATSLIMLATVLVELAAARGIVSTLANSGIIGLSTYSTNLLTLLAIAAGTDWAIFLVGRYQEARGAVLVGGEKKPRLELFRGLHVVLESAGDVLALAMRPGTACPTSHRCPPARSRGES